MANLSLIKLSSVYIILFVVGKKNKLQKCLIWWQVQQYQCFQENKSKLQNIFVMWFEIYACST